MKRILTAAILAGVIAVSVPVFARQTQDAKQESSVKRLWERVKTDAHKVGNKIKTTGHNAKEKLEQK